MGEINVEFPCGYKIHVKLGLLDVGSASAPEICPIHGKDCKRK